jgi:hypothetical protein
MATPNWLLGRDLLGLDVYGGSRDASGTITWDGSPASLLGRVDYVRVSDDRMLEMIQSVDGDYAHYEKVLMDFSLVVGEILKRTSGTSPAVATILPDLAQSTDIVKVVFKRGSADTTGNYEQYTFLGVIRSFSDGVTAFGKNACELTLAPIADGSTAPLVYATP